MCVLLGAPKVSVHCDGEAFGSWWEEGSLSWFGWEGVAARKD